MKKTSKKSLFTCKTVLKNLKFHNFCYNNDNYLKLSGFVYFLQKEKKILEKFQSNKTNLKT